MDYTFVLANKHYQLLLELLIDIIRFDVCDNFAPQIVLIKQLMHCYNDYKRQTHGQSTQFFDSTAHTIYN